MTETQTSALRQELDSAAADATETARRAARDTGETVKDRARSEVETAADAASAAGERFDPDSLQAEAAQQIARGLDQLAVQLRDTDLSGAARSATRFARENPAVTLGGAALLGFAVARFLKASADPETAAADAPREAGSDPWTGHVTGPDAETPASDPSRVHTRAYGGARHG
ncbi:hypothetical protein Dshi_4180 (plasmid) [Dinoroseobacter shibae DFL 12 = DSM 16493]|jgi:hypothetical protein|uniref:DUF3618 domain-containing protein n=1 Tax=Dinoroseobacter shibae (strain DSM 16493 / NCIMB 14021 / DFL 12) TaxID=398580 RepID=A8LUH3_DINSH|nr:hypothetical protein [Dinoroseobacter shibae]ABV95890.1 hypothetical protein Dshi_4180 [Dinoroseobacter shibae DFL 12 = DSM 16493]URF49205.1 hypothetical protein M8008_21375 [Dinoroseobacter shibae]URF53513.1 hypothetical protein M8007_21400 [Dinoroseobacter shibae]